MTASEIAWPQKTRDLHNHHMDSTRWDNFPFRDDDVIVSTYGKSGTTWTQQIVGQLIFAGRDDVSIHEISPWLDLRIMPPEIAGMLEAQQHRRVIKTHLPLDALKFSPKAKYIYIGRDGRDVIWSMYNHHVNANELWYNALNLTPGLVGPPIDKPDPDIRRYFVHWMENDGAPFWSYWDNARTWWAARNLPNVRVIHFNDLKADLGGEMRKLADFLEVDIPEEKWPEVISHCTFDYMKANADRMAPLGGAIFEGGGKTFINKGSNGRWRDVLSAEESAAFEKKAVEELGAECAEWFATGKR
ncbi:sulfotransferase domain-containing protein [soil metagenome]